MNLLNESASIIVEGSNDSYHKVMMVLEDFNSPVTRKYQEKLYQDVLNKGHIDFGDIPNSKGNIESYSGYNNMIDTLENLYNFSIAEKSKDLEAYVKIVQDAIKYIIKNKQLYQKGFATKNDYVILEYNTFVFTCVEGTTSLLYNFIDYIKTPSSGDYKIVLKDTKYRANLFYIEQLAKYNKINANTSYTKYLATVLNSGKEHLFGIDDAAIIGIGVVSAIALSIIPVTRALIYNFKDLQRKISEDTATMAYYLEMNKSVVEANDKFDLKKKQKIITKQQKIINILHKVSDKLRITSAKADAMSKKSLSNENKAITMDSLRDDVENSDFSFM